MAGLREYAVYMSLVTRMAGSGEELVSRKTSASSNLSELDRRGFSPSIYDLNEGSYIAISYGRRILFDRHCQRTIHNVPCYYAPINIMPHYPPSGHYRGQHRGIDIENQAPDRGIWHACIRYLSNPLSFPHPGRGIEWGFDRWGWPHLTGSWRVD